MKRDRKNVTRDDGQCFLLTLNALCKFRALCQNSQYPIVRSLLRGQDHLIGDFADPLNLNLDNIPVFQPKLWIEKCSNTTKDQNGSFCLATSLIGKH